MKERKSRQEINLSRLLVRCQEIANTSSDLSQEWRLPKFVSSCESMLSSLPQPPDPTAPSSDAMLEYRNSLALLRKLVPDTSAAEEELFPSCDTSQSRAPLPLPQGEVTGRNTVSRQIYQRAVERQQGTMREQLLGTGTGGGSKEEHGYGPGANLDKILAEHKDQQERVAEEMIALTRSLKEQSVAAGAMLRKDTVKLEQAAENADTNLAKLTEETQRVSEFSSRGCRCWIWLMMLLVVLTFLGMVLTMRLFRKKVHPAVPVYEEAVTPPPPKPFKSEL